MPEDRRHEFMKRLSSMGMGARESVQVILAGIVYDIREDIQRKRFADEELDAVISFHDRAEALWRESLASNPPMEPRALIDGLTELRGGCTGSLAQFARKLERGVEHMERFEQERDD